jgi:phosphatidylinositol glycan class K
LYCTYILFKHANDYDIGVAVIDAYTHYVLQFMENINKTSQASMTELVRTPAPFLLVL